MDPISYGVAAKQKQRIEKVIAEPDSTSGIVTVPQVIATGETITIPAGRTVVHPNLTVSGTLDVQGTLFVPAGGSVTQSLVDATVVKQNGSVVANDSTVVHKTGDETIAGVKTFSNNTVMNGNVGICSPNPKARLDVYASGIAGGLPVATGNAADPSVMARISGGSVCMDIGVEAAGHQWIQCRGINDYSLKYDLHLQPSGGNVLVTGSGGLGYGTGSGGTVTQLTSKSTLVTLNKHSGQITMNNASLAAGAVVVFSCNNNLITQNDQISVSFVYDGLVDYTHYNLWWSIQTNNIVFYLKNISTIDRSHAVIIKFSIIKGAIA